MRDPQRPDDRAAPDRRAASWLGLALLVGCPTPADPPADAGPPSIPDAGPPSALATDLDLLFVIDNSGSMTEEQANLTAELPRLFEILASGDVDGDGVADLQPFETVQAGVVTTDMGTGGFTLPTCVNSSFGDDGVLRTAGLLAIIGCVPEYPRWLQRRATDPALEPARDLACLSHGTGGCGFEQPLEALLKALSPARPTPGTAPGYEPPRFFGDTLGHGDDRHQGFVRDDSLLAIVTLSDEEDCSARDPDLFNPSSAVYTADLNLRCFVHAQAAMHPIERYVEGLLQLRRAPDRLVFVPIVGVPVDLQTPVDGPTDWPALISPDPEVRDDRMEQRSDPMNPTRLVPSCNEPGTGLAFPPVREARLAQGLEARGARVAMASVCTSDLSGAIDRLVYALRR